MLLRTIAIAAGLTFAAATIAPAVSSVAFAKDHSHSGSADKSGHQDKNHGDKNHGDKNHGDKNHGDKHNGDKNDKGKDNNKGDRNHR